MDWKMLSPEEREEYDALLYEAGYDEVGNRLPSRLIGDRMHTLLADAVQAGRVWASYVIDDDARTGHLSRFKKWDKAKHPINVKHGTVIVPRAAVMGVKRRDPATGAVVHQLALFAEMSWDELVGVLESTQSRIASARITVGMCTKLLALKLRSPESAGPGDACDRLGVDMEDYLVDDEAA